MNTRKEKRKERKLYEEIYKAKHGRYPPFVFKVLSYIRFHLILSLLYLPVFINLISLLLLLLLILKYISSN